MAISDLFRKKAVQNTMEIEPGIVLNVYGSSQQEATKVLEAYAGKDKAQQWQHEPEYQFKKEDYQGEKRGLSFQYHGRTIDGPIPIPGVANIRSVSTPVGDTQLIDGAGPVRASQNGRVINININLAELPGFQGRPTEAGIARMREEFKHTLREVMARVVSLEAQLKAREQEIERLQLSRNVAEGSNKSPSVKTDGAMAAKTGLTRSAAQQPEVVFVDEKLRAPKRHEIVLEAPNAFVTDRLSYAVKGLASAYLKSDNPEYKAFGTGLMDASKTLKNAAKEQDVPKTHRVELTFPESKATVLLKQAIENVGVECQKVRFGKEVMSDADKEAVKTVFTREMANLQNIFQEQAKVEKAKLQQKNIESPEDRVAHRAVEKESIPKGTLIETVKAAQEFFGKDVVFVSTNWESHKGEIVQSSERILRAAQATEKSMQNAGLSTAYCISASGVVRNLNTNRDEFFLCSRAAAQDEAFPERLRVALQKHFDGPEMTSSLSPKVPAAETPSMGVSV